MPPSPASVCSSVQEEFWKFSDHHSPISTSDVTPRDENCVSQVFRDISSNLKGPWNCLFTLCGVFLPMGNDVFRKSSLPLFLDSFILRGHISRDICSLINCFFLCYHDYIVVISILITHI